MPARTRRRQDRSGVVHAASEPSQAALARFGRRLDEALKARAEQAAAREDRSLSSLIVRAVAAYLDVETEAPIDDAKPPRKRVAGGLA